MSISTNQVLENFAQTSYRFIRLSISTNNVFLVPCTFVPTGVYHKSKQWIQLLLVIW